jgi:hypothetical protein
MNNDWVPFAKYSIEIVVAKSDGNGRREEVALYRLPSRGVDRFFRKGGHALYVSEQKICSGFGPETSKVSPRLSQTFFLRTEPTTRHPKAAQGFPVSKHSLEYSNNSESSDTPLAVSQCTVTGLDVDRIYFVLIKQFWHFLMLNWH